MKFLRNLLIVIAMALAFSIVVTPRDTAPAAQCGTKGFQFQKGSNAALISPSSQTRAEGQARHPGRQSIIFDNPFNGAVSTQPGGT